MCVKTNTTEKSYLTGLSELDWNFSTINTSKDDSDNNRFCWTFSIKKCIYPQHPAGTSKDSDKCDSIKRF